MKLVANFLGLHHNEKKTRRKTFEAYRDELLIKQGREQFRKLIAKGLTIPVAYL